MRDQRRDEMQDQPTVRYCSTAMNANLPMPIRTPRLLLRPRIAGDGEFASSAVRETWDELHRWMCWAEDLAQFSPQQLELRNRDAMTHFLQRTAIELIGFEVGTAQPVIWCGLHSIDWATHRCDTGFWVRRSAQRRGIATESTNAMVRYAFGALGMRRVGLTHSDGNEASRRVAEKLGFAHVGVERDANPLPGGLVADKFCYARSGTEGLPPLDVRWGGEDDPCQDS